MIRRFTVLLFTVLLSVGGSASVRSQTASGATEAGDENLHSMHRKGIRFAFEGNLTRAESTFIQALSGRREDARALTNLGNLEVLRGNPKRALFFYDAAELADTNDAGIAMNQGTALFLLGDTTSADLAYARGITRAGGVREAANLLGLDVESEDYESKAVDKPRLRKEDLLRRIHSALKLIAPKKRPRLKVGAARGTGEEATASVLYWGQ